MKGLVQDNKIFGQKNNSIDKEKSVIEEKDSTKPADISTSNAQSGSVDTPSKSVSKMDMARQKMDEMITYARDNNKPAKDVLRPYVAGIRAGIIDNSMSYKEFNDKYGTKISQASFSEYCPKGDIDLSKMSNTMVTESELRSIAGL